MAGTAERRADRSAVTPIIAVRWLACALAIEPALHRGPRPEVPFNDRAAASRTRSSHNARRARNAVERERHSSAQSQQCDPSRREPLPGLSDGLMIVTLHSQPPSHRGGLFTYSLRFVSALLMNDTLSCAILWSGLTGFSSLPALLGNPESMIQRKSVWRVATGRC